MCRRESITNKSSNSNYHSNFKVLMVRRSSKSHFMPNVFVFPGGKMDPEDGGNRRICAVRELFEETGFLVGGRGVLEKL